MIFYQHYRKEYVNPYRTGVKIGNYNEDLFGEELSEKYKGIRIDPKMYISENHGQYTNPKQRPQTANCRIRVNDLTMPQTSNFDMNIDFTNKNFEDYMKLQKRNEFILDDKNQFYKEEIKQQKIENSNNNYHNRPKSSYCQRYKQNDTIYDTKLIDETQKVLSQTNMKDAAGVLVTKDYGLKGNLFFGHGKPTNDFYKNEYATTNQLAYQEREKTDKFLNPKYKIKNNFKFQPKKEYDNKDWNFRNYRHYDRFTKSFDVPKNLPSK